MNKNPNKEKISTGDSLAVQCLRILEQRGMNSECQPENISIPDTEYDSAGRLTAPFRFLAQRAEILLPKYHLRSAIIRNSFFAFILTGIVLILLFGLAVIPLAKSNLILGTSTTNLAGPFFFFVVIQIFFLTLSVLFLFLTGILYFTRICFKGKRAAENISDKSGWLSAASGMTLLYLARLIGRCRKKWAEQKILRQKSSPNRNENLNQSSNRHEDSCHDSRLSLLSSNDFDQITSEISKAQKTTADFFSFIAERRIPFFCLSGFYSHLLWLVVSVSLLFCLLMNMQKTIYHYRWESSITSIEEVRLAIDKIAFLYPKKLRPNEEEIRSLFNKPVDTGSPESVVRRSWSLFVLWTILITCVLPRGILTAIFLFKFRRSLKCYEPNLNDPYFRKIIKNAEDSIGRIQTEDVSLEGTAPENDANGTLPLPISLKFGSPFSSSKSSAESSQTAPDAISPNQPSLSAVRSSAIRSSAIGSSDNIPAYDKFPPNADIDKSQSQNKSSEESNSQTNPLRNSDSELFDNKETPQTSATSKTTGSNLNNLTSPAPNANRAVSVKPNSGANSTPPEMSNVTSDSAISQNSDVPSETLFKSASKNDLSSADISIRQNSRTIPNRQEIVIGQEFSNSQKVPNRTVAFGYDTEMSEDQWRKILKEEPLDLFGNIAANRKLKNEFRELIEKNAPTIKNLIVLLDSSATPVRQQILFFGDIFQTVTSAKITILLSCGDRLRRLFNRDLSKITQRLDDWRSALEELRYTLNLTLEISTSFDHQKATAESCMKLQRYLSGQPEQIHWSGSRLDKAFLLIRQETKTVFDLEPLCTNPEQDLARITALYKGIEKIYQEESHRLWEESKRLWSSRGQLFPPSRSALANEGNRTNEEAPTENSAFEKLQEFLPSPISLDDLKNKVLPSAALMNKTRNFCSRLSGKGALALGALGAALPLAAAVAPLVSAPLTFASLATAAAGLGSLLPASLTAGSAGAALGAITPASLTALRDKIKNSFISIFERKQKDPAADLFQNEKKTRLIETLVGTGALWTIVFELQGEPEEVITEKLAVLLDPLEEAVLKTPEDVNQILNEIRDKRFE